MSNGFNFQGYAGSVEVSVEDKCLHGRLLFVNDLITYEGQNVAELEASFRAAVTRYLAFCKKAGKAPERPCSGSFNVRLGPVLHRKAAIAAAQARIKLNEYVVNAVEAATSPQKVVHEHHLMLDDHQHVSQLVATASNSDVKWEMNGYVQ